MMRLAFIVCLVLAQGAFAKPVSYALQSADSSVGFTWFMGNDAIEGQMPVAAADLALDFERVADSRVAVTLDVRNSRAGFPFADQAMKGPKVLWAERFPTITFRSTRVTPDGVGAVIQGDLTIRGVTRPVALTARLFRPQGAAEDDRSRLTIRLTTSVKRSDFGADGWDDMVGDEVKLDIVARVREQG